MLIIDKAFGKAMDGRFGENIVCDKGKSISRVSVPVIMKNCPILDGNDPV